MKRSRNVWRRNSVRVLGVVALVAASLGLAGPARAAVSYYLPFANGTTAVMTQGPGGGTSHNTTSTQYAYDFDLNGGEVWASAPGTIKAKVDSVTGQTGSGYGNYVIVEHTDGTCTRYAHLAHGTVTSLSIGAAVDQGEYLGEEGNTGYTLPVGGGHHVHFQRESCSSGNSVVVDFVESNWTSQNPGPGAGEPGITPLVRNHRGYDHSYYLNGVVSAENLRTGLDFNGDGKTDVFTNWGSGWQVMYGPAFAGWNQVSGSSQPLENLGFGDFNGDGKTDVFSTWGTGWKILYAPFGGGWQTVSQSSRELPDLGFGDFNGDGATDVFTNWGSGWQVMYGPAFAGWNQVSGSSQPLENLGFGDFNGDGKTDVFSTWGTGWKILYAPFGAGWQTVSQSSRELPELGL